MGFNQDAHAIGGTLSDKSSCEAIGGSWVINYQKCVVESLTINSGETLTIEFLYGWLENSGTITNYGTINSGTITNSGSITNYGTITNFGRIDNSGTINNLSTITNSGVINNQCGAGYTGNPPNDHPVKDVCQASSKTPAPTPSQEPKTQSTTEPVKSASKIPDWVKNTMEWYIDGKVSETEMINALQFLIKQGIIKI
jgi:hypothetical protein